jgi:hypothetical protein
LNDHATRIDPPAQGSAVRPFIVHTRDGEAQPVTNVERLSVGRNAIAYTDEDGYISLIPLFILHSLFLLSLRAV